MQTFASGNAHFSFANLVANSTTANFTIPVGSYQVTVSAKDPNAPGITTVQDANNSNVAVTTVTTIIENQFGLGGRSYFLAPAGNKYNINVTADVYCVQIDQTDGY